MWVVGGLLLAGLVILAWVTVPTLRRHVMPSMCLVIRGQPLLLRLALF